MISQKFWIELDGPRSTYAPGEKISGKVFLIVDAPKKITVLKLEMKEESRVYWDDDTTETNSKNQRTTVHDNFYASEELFKDQVYFISGRLVELPVGTHSWSFSFVLSPNLPSSFESIHGHVRYTVEATLERPWKFRPDRIRKYFKVLCPLDLNRLPNASKPIVMEDSKTFCRLCCKTKPFMIVNVSVPCRGYIPGQIIPVKVEVKNNSGVAVNKLKIKLTENVTYYATIPRRSQKNFRRIITEDSKGPIGGDETINRVQYLMVPSDLAPSNLENCEIIDLKYFLEAEACFEKCYHSNLELITGIIVGTVPLMNFNMFQALSASPK